MAVTTLKAFGGEKRRKREVGRRSSCLKKEAGERGDEYSPRKSVKATRQARQGK